MPPTMFLVENPTKSKWPHLFVKLSIPYVAVSASLAALGFYQTDGRLLFASLAAIIALPCGAAAVRHWRAALLTLLLLFAWFGAYGLYSRLYGVPLSPIVTRGKAASDEGNVIDPEFLKTRIKNMIERSRDFEKRFALFDIERALNDAKYPEELLQVAYLLAEVDPHRRRK